MKRVLVLGSSGFIGSWIVSSLLDRGWEVVGIGRRRQRLSYPYISLDLDSPSPEERFCNVLGNRHFDAIVNCIGGGYVSTSTVKGRERLLSYNLKPMQFLTSVLPKLQGVERIIHLGSVSSYGVRLGEEMNETSEKTPRTAHEIAKYEAEQAVKEVAKQFRLKWIIFQPAQVYGPGDKTSDLASLLKLVKKWKVFPIVGKGDNKMVPLVYVKDVAELVCRAIERTGVGNEEFMLAWERLSWSEFADKVKSVIPVKVVHIPSALFKVGVWCEDRFFRLFGREPIFSYERVAYLLGDRLYDGRKVLRKFMFSPTPLEEGLKETLEWLN